MSGIGASGIVSHSAEFVQPILLGSREGLCLFLG